MVQHRCVLWDMKTRHTANCTPAHYHSITTHYHITIPPSHSWKLHPPPGLPVGGHWALRRLKHTLTSVLVVEVQPSTGLAVVEVPRVWVGEQVSRTTASCIREQHTNTFDDMQPLPMYRVEHHLDTGRRQQISQCRWYPLRIYTSQKGDAKSWWLSVIPSHPSLPCPSPIAGAANDLSVS